jgi:hypothetical protein
MAVDQFWSGYLTLDDYNNHTYFTSFSNPTFAIPTALQTKYQDTEQLFDAMAETLTETFTMFTNGLLQGTYAHISEIPIHTRNMILRAFYSSISNMLTNNATYLHYYSSWTSSSPSGQNITQQTLMEVPLWSIEAGRIFNRLGLVQDIGIWPSILVLHPLDNLETFVPVQSDLNQIYTDAYTDATTGEVKLVNGVTIEIPDFRGFDQDNSNVIFKATGTKSIASTILGRPNINVAKYTMNADISKVQEDIAEVIIANHLSVGEYLKLASDSTVTLWKPEVDFDKVVEDTDMSKKLFAGENITLTKANVNGQPDPNGLNYLIASVGGDVNVGGGSPMHTWNVVGADASSTSDTYKFLWSASDKTAFTGFVTDGLETGKKYLPVLYVNNSGIKVQTQGGGSFWSIDGFQAFSPRFYTKEELETGSFTVQLSTNEVLITNEFDTPIVIQVNSQTTGNGEFDLVLKSTASGHAFSTVAGDISGANLDISIAFIEDGTDGSSGGQYTAQKFLDHYEQSLSNVVATRDTQSGKLTLNSPVSDIQGKNNVEVNNTSGVFAINTKSYKFYIKLPITETGSGAFNFNISNAERDELIQNVKQVVSNSDIEFVISIKLLVNGLKLTNGTDTPTIIEVADNIATREFVLNGSEFYGLSSDQQVSKLINSFVYNLNGLNTTSYEGARANISLSYNLWSPSSYLQLSGGEIAGYDENGNKVELTYMGLSGTSTITDIVIIFEVSECKSI